MTAAADLVLIGGTVHTLDAKETVHDAIAIRDGRVVGLGQEFDIRARVGVETDVIDVDGAAILPGFVDTHTHLLPEGQRLVHADLRGAEGPTAVRERLRGYIDNRDLADPAVPDEWIAGVGLDDGMWDEPLTGTDLAEVADRPVAVVREDRHGAILNEAGMAALGDEIAADDRDTDGRVYEAAVGVVEDAITPDGSQRFLLERAQRRAHERGLTGIHDLAVESPTARAYRQLDRDGELTLRTRLFHRRSGFEGLRTSGLVRNQGGDRLVLGGLKLFADGSLGSHTARLAAPYHDRSEHRGRWVTPPEELADAVTAADETDLQVAIHAIGDDAIDAALDAIETAPGWAGPHRIEHLELATDAQIDRLASSGAIAAVQPNFHKWAEPDGLYDRRLGTKRRRRTNRLARLADGGVDLIFGSDGMPLDPLVGLQHAVNAPTPAQELAVTPALRAYTGSKQPDATAPIATGRSAELVVLDDDPWTDPSAIVDRTVELTIAAGSVVYDGR